MCLFDRFTFVFYYSRKEMYDVDPSLMYNEADLSLIGPRTLK